MMISLKYANKKTHVKMDDHEIVFETDNHPEIDKIMLLPIELLTCSVVPRVRA